VNQNRSQKIIIKGVTPILFMNFKTINIGSLIRQRVEDCGIEKERIGKYFKCSEGKIEEMYQSENLNTDILLKWSKLLKYDFFRIYTQHIILFAPQNVNHISDLHTNHSKMPEFRKNIYTKELIDFILEIIETGEKSINDVINEYKIPKTTVNRWLYKYSKRRGRP